MDKIDAFCADIIHFGEPIVSIIKIYGPSIPRFFETYSSKAISAPMYLQQFRYYHPHDCASHQRAFSQRGADSSLNLYCLTFIIFPNSKFKQQPIKLVCLNL
jgi:hypothetical protein